jgi:FlaA1/EpsC-like NDP-sugar epimerase
VTVTHPEMRRFFMLIPEAVQLVMHAASHAERGATYVLDMGNQVKLVDMAYDMIRLSGFVPNKEIKVEFIGLRPGEKLSEELVGADEEVSPGKVEKIQCVRRRCAPPAGLIDRVAELEKEAACGNRDAVVATLIELTGLNVPQPTRYTSPPPPRMPTANILVHHATTHARNAALPRSSRRGHLR